MAKTRNTTTPASSSKKRPRIEPTERVIIDTTVEELESSNHSAEDILSSDDDSAAVPILKKSRYAIKFINTELETRYRDYNFVNRKVIYGKSVVGSEFTDCGLVDIFESIGMRSLIDLPDVCYPFLVREFYANLHEPSKGRYVSRVRDQGIVLNATILNGMLEVKNLTDDLVVPLTKKGICDLFEDLPELEQHALVRGDVDNTDVTLPTTAMLEPMAHLLFKICRTNISPRVGSRSLLTCQDLILVSLLLKKKKFNISGLILHNMVDCLKKKTRAFPYALLLTRVFEFSGVKLEEKEAVDATEFIDCSSLAQSSLQINELGFVEKIPPPVVQVPVSTSSLPESSSAATGIQELFAKLEDKFAAIQRDFAEYKQVVHEVKTQNTEIKSMATDLLGYFQKAKSAVRAAKEASGVDKEADQTAAKDSSNPQISSPAIASGSSDVPPPVNQDQAAVDDLFAD
ncbi:hypothetical protein ACET3Z_010024 [Daucus carota]